MRHYGEPRGEIRAEGCFVGKEIVPSIAVDVRNGQPPDVLAGLGREDAGHVEPAGSLVGRDESPGRGIHAERARVDPGEQVGQSVCVDVARSELCCSSGKCEVLLRIECAALYRILVADEDLRSRRVGYRDVRRTVIVEIRDHRVVGIYPGQERLRRLELAATRGILEQQPNGLSIYVG